MLWFFVFFLVSGFCSVLYEIVWLRLAMAQFGVTSAMVSIVLSFFMGGLGLGSWLSGRLIRKYGDRPAIPALRLYAITEFLIATSALLVPQELLWGRDLLERAGFSSSGAYYLASGLCVALTLIPWCACMGATIPVGMLAIRRSVPTGYSGSFSYLYLSNVLGAVGGALVPPLLVEAFGFHGTLRIGMLLNILLGLSAFTLSTIESGTGDVPRLAHSDPIRGPGLKDARTLILLFMTGLTSMGMEVVWIRQFTPYLGTMVYSFALILAIYLGCTFLGSRVYRRQMWRNPLESRLTWALLTLCCILPLVMAQPGFGLNAGVRVLLGIGPFSAALGFITPMLVDRWSGGDPDRAGTAYAINVLGCILGPLIAGFLLLPFFSERWVLGILSLPWLIVAVRPAWLRITIEPGSARKNVLSYALLTLAIALVIWGRDYQQAFPQSLILRDNTATVVAYGQGLQKHLLVNGIGMTELSTAPKMMAHLPLAFLDHQPHNALVICFGMGTTYRSLLSWGISVTAVELVPSVPNAFPYFYADAQQLLSSPRSQIVIDDGRRYLERTSGQYDVITIDPPPPVTAAGSSLLYSKEFYSIIRERLAPGGILQQWLPEGDAQVRSSVTRALVESFSYVRIFLHKPAWGYHFLASEHPIPRRAAVELMQRMPATAVRDLQEWDSAALADPDPWTTVALEQSPAQMLALSPQTPPMQDDRPFNEYFLLRNWRRHKRSVLATSKRAHAE